VRLDRASQRSVVAALVALPIEGFGLAQQVTAALVRISARNVAGRLAEQLGRLQIAALSQCDIALGGGRTRGAQHLGVLRRLRLLLELARLLRAAICAWVACRSSS
jgi:hypothetical protein